MTVEEAIQSIDGVRYVTTKYSCDLLIALDYGATVDVIEEIKRVKPVSLELGEIAASQEHIVEIEANHQEEM